MNRRDFFLGVLSLALAVKAVQAQARHYRIGYLTSATPDAYNPTLDVFITALARHGYQQGRNLTLVQRWSGSPGASAELEKHAVELTSLPVDAIVTWGTQATAAAQKATRHIPIVMANSADPLGSKFVESLARPGGNITGISSLSTDLSGKVLSLLNEVVPNAKRIGVFRNPGNPVSKRHLQSAQRSAKTLDVELFVAEVHGGDLAAAFARLSAASVQAAIALADPAFVSHRAEFATLLLRYRLPVAFQRSENVEAGGLISYSADLREQFRLAAGYVHRILLGAAPSDLPVLQPAKVELVANLKTARALGLTIPQAVLLRVDRVIE